MALANVKGSDGKLVLNIRKGNKAYTANMSGAEINIPVHTYFFGLGRGCYNILRKSLVKQRLFIVGLCLFAFVRRDRVSCHMSCSLTNAQGQALGHDKMVEFKFKDSGDIEAVNGVTMSLFDVVQEKMNTEASPIISYHNLVRTPDSVSYTHLTLPTTPYV